MFLTPYLETNKLRQEFNNLELSNKKHKKIWIYWNLNKNCIVDIIRGILSLESESKINPINEYIRHTLKAFIIHYNLTTDITSQRIIRNGENIGEIVEETQIKIKNGNFRVVRRDSFQIQVFNLETGDKEIARHVLAEYIDENYINIAHKNYNTRTIGKKFFEWKNNTI